MLDFCNTLCDAIRETEPLDERLIRLLVDHSVQFSAESIASFKKQTSSRGGGVVGYGHSLLHLSEHMDFLVALRRLEQSYATPPANLKKIIQLAECRLRKAQIAVRRCEALGRKKDNFEWTFTFNLDLWTPYALLALFSNDDHISADQMTKILSVLGYPSHSAWALVGSVFAHVVGPVSGSALRMHLSLMSVDSRNRLRGFSGRGSDAPLHLFETWPSPSATQQDLLAASPKHGVYMHGLPRRCAYKSPKIEEELRRYIESIDLEGDKEFERIACAGMGIELNEDFETITNGHAVPLPIGRMNIFDNYCQKAPLAMEWAIGCMLVAFHIDPNTMWPLTGWRQSSAVAQAPNYPSHTGDPSGVEAHRINIAAFLRRASETQCEHSWRTLHFMAEKLDFLDDFAEGLCDTVAP